MMHAKKPYGLLMAGGNSSRMGFDKAMYSIEGIPQYKRAEQLLSLFCDDVYISSKADAAYEGRLLFDPPGFSGCGPASGLLSAFCKHSGPWLVLGVDYPAIEHSDVLMLFEQRDANAVATCYMNAQGFYEPLTGLYETAFFEPLKTAMENGNFSLQQILIQEKAKGVVPADPNRIKSFDRPGDYKSYLP